MENIKRGIPGFGDIPILGMLFNSRQFQRNETELVVVITARLISPLNGADMPPLPGKESHDPNDIGVFFMNVFEETKPPKSAKQIPSRRGRVISHGEDQPATDSTSVLGSFGYWR